MAAQQTPDDTGVEGLDDEIAGLGTYPLDTVLIRTEHISVYQMVRRIEQKKYVMDPDYQRDFIWNEDKQSKLIESVIMRIPLPAFYLAEDENGRMVVVDGLQRLSTIHHFLTNKVRLKLDDQKELNNKLFKELSPKLQNRIEDCNLILYVIDSKVPERARLDIFERVNSGERLTRQQMRNCLYIGQATRFLKEEALTPLFVKVTGSSLDSGKMVDRELVNRFCAFFLLPVEEYKGDMDEHLALALKKMNTLDASALANMSGQFRNALENADLLFGAHAVRKFKPEQTRRRKFNASLWDILTTSLAVVPPDVVGANAAEFRTRFEGLMKDENFVESITVDANGATMVRHRFHVMRQVVREVFGAYSP
jgi:hypothetical protein